MRRYVASILLFLILSIASTGCWDRKELNSLSIVTGVAVDIDEKDQEKVSITAQIVNPRAIAPGQSGGAGGTQTEPVLNQQASGYTLLDAVRKSTTQTGRRLYFPHNQIVIVSEDVARTKGTEYFLDFFLRDPEPRRSAWILVADGKARELFSSRALLDEVPSVAIANVLRAQTSTSQVASITIHQFTQELISKSGAPIAPYIKQIGEDMRFVGTTVFKGTKMIDSLDLAETRGLLWARGLVKGGVIVAKCNQDGKKVSLEIMKASGRVTPELRNGEITIRIDVEAQTNLAGQQCSHDLSTRQALASLRKQQNTVIENEIKAALKKARIHGADIFLFANAIYRKYPDKWKELESHWEEVFPKLQVDIHVKSTIQHVGMILQSAEPPTHAK